MATYLSTFISGLAGPVADALRDSLSDFQAITTSDTLVTYKTSKSADVIRRLGFLNNSFLLLSTYEPVPKDSSALVQRVVDDVSAARALRGSRADGERTFRVMFSKENRTVGLHPSGLVSLESRIAAATRLRPDRHRADVEYWLLLRRERIAYLTKRLTTHSRPSKHAERGLRPELAQILSRLSQPESADAFLDPFCGSAAIAIERAKSAYRVIFASDIDKDKVLRLRSQYKRRLKSRNNRFNIRCDDARALQRYEPGFINKIVTDPPWNLPHGHDLTKFYVASMTEMLRILRPGGLAVLLIGPKVVFENAIDRLAAPVELMTRHDVLVDGQKAGVYKFIRGRHGGTKARRHEVEDPS